jgi:hypothetical protein
VLRLQDRAWLRFDKPKSWVVQMSPCFTSETELWLHVFIGTLDTLVRIPYEVLTPFAPTGG